MEVDLAIIPPTDTAFEMIRSPQEERRYAFMKAWSEYILASPLSKERADLWMVYVEAREAYLPRHLIF